MMKTTVLRIMMVVGVMVGMAPLYANASDEKSAYVSLTGEYIPSAQTKGEFFGIDFSQEFDNGAAGLSAIGYHFNDYIRAELEGGYRHLSLDVVGIEEDSLDFKMFSALANLYVDIPTDSQITPYFGAGLGFVQEVEEGGRSLAYQAMAGLNYKLSDSSSVFAGYRYFGITDLIVEIESHGVDIGYRYNF